MRKAALFSTRMRLLFAERVTFFVNVFTVASCITFLISALLNGDRDLAVLG